MSFITPYPRRGEMDEGRPGMDDEATPDPDPFPYDADDVPAEEEDEEEILDHDTNDLVDPHWAEHRGGGVGEDRGSGQGDQSGGGGGEHRGSGDAPARVCTADEDEAVCSHTSRLQHLQRIQRIAKTEIRGAAGEQLHMVVARVAKVEGKRFRAKMAGKPEVRAMINASNAAEAELYRRRQEDFADLMDQRKKKAEAERAVNESQGVEFFRYQSTDVFKVFLFG